MFLCRTTLLCCFIGFVVSATPQSEDTDSELVRRLSVLRHRIRNIRQSGNNQADLEQYIGKLVRELISSDVRQAQYNPPKADSRPKPALSQREWTFLYDGGARGTSPVTTSKTTVLPWLSGSSDHDTNTTLPPKHSEETKKVKCQSLILTLLKDGKVSVQVGESKD